MALINYYNERCTNIQNHLQSMVGELPQNFVNSSVKSFAISFIATVIVVKKNPLKAGLTAGTMSMCGTAMDAFARKIIHYSKVSLSTEILSDVAKISFVGTLYLGRALGFHLNNEVSFICSAGIYLYNLGNRASSPIFGIVAHG